MKINITYNKLKNSIVLTKNNYFKVLKNFYKKYYKLKEKDLDISFFVRDKEILDDVSLFIKVFNNQSKELINTYVYDNVCQKLDEEFQKNNYCKFNCDKCLGNREKMIAFSENGCCHSFEYSKFYKPTLIENIKLCKLLKDKKCTTKNISCKLFTCRSLKKKGITYNSKKIFLLYTFYDSKQHLIINYNFFKTREELLLKLNSTTNLPYVFYYMSKQYII